MNPMERRGPCSTAAAVLIPFVLAVAAALPGAGPAAAPLRFDIAPGGKSNLVEFESKAPLETFRGKTDRVSGFVLVDPEELYDSLVLHVEIDMASIDTGLDIRNRHMRENHLETDRFPVASFDGAALVEPHAVGLPAGRKTHLEIEGMFLLHGVKRKVVLPVDVIRVEGNGTAYLAVTSRFELKLSDYNIDRPKFLVMKLGDVQHIELTLRAVSGE